MIYLCTNNAELCKNDFIRLSEEETLEKLNKVNLVQYDSETTGTDSRIDKLLSMQFGNDKEDFQIVVDATTVNPLIFKEVLETKWIVGQNLKFDLEFLYSVGIIPRKVWDTMITEQSLHLGYPSGVMSYSLKAIAKRRLNVDLDKSIRGQIIWRGLDKDVITYAANDVLWLEKIMNSQYEDLKKENSIKAAKLENAFTPAIAYLEWCGIKLDADKWKEKMENDRIKYNEAIKNLNDFVSRTPILQSMLSEEGKYQEDLFSEVKEEPIISYDINWSSSQQVIQVAKKLGFNTRVQDKKTGEDKDSVLEKTLKTQKGINDEFLDLYFKYQEAAKVCSTYGQSQLNMINPITGRCHTVYRAIGASSGRMSCGSQQPNTSLAKLKGISPRDCTYCNFQQLPADEQTRGAFVAEEGNVLCDCDYSALESYLAAEIYNDKDFQYEFTEGSKDTHSLFAWMVFRDECIACGCKSVADVKKLAPQWRKKVKAVEFAWLFGAAAPTISQSANCSIEEAEEYIKRLEEGFKGISKFAKEGSAFVRKNGYILMNKYTGHKMYWWDHDKWLERQKSFTPEFWEDYRNNHKGTGDQIAQEVRQHFQAAAKWDRMARNSVTQGTGATIIKTASTNLFNYIVDNNLFGIVKICAIVHDEILAEYPESMPEIKEVIENTMEDAARQFCKFATIPAQGEVAKHWVH